MRTGVQKIIVDRDTLIHIGGIPFEIKKGTPIYGLDENYKLACIQFDTDVSKPCHVASRDKPPSRRTIKSLSSSSMNDDSASASSSEE